ncbi:major tail protein [Fusibacter sp. JL298sf-3]
MQIGLKNIHVAPLESDTLEQVAYGAIRKIAPAMAVNINPNVSETEVYGDDQLQETFSTLGKIEVEIEVNALTMEERAFFLGGKIEDGVLIESKDDVAPYVAMAFESLKGNGKKRFVWLTKGKASMPGEEYATKKEGVDPKTPKLKITFMPRVYDGNWKYSADEDEQSFTGADTWYTKVPYKPAV